MKSSYRASLILTPILVLFTIPACYLGIFRPSTYAAEEQTIITQALGQDAVTLFVGVPALLALWLLTLRGSLRARLAWLGVVGYFLYTYASYALGLKFNRFFLLYVLLFGLSFWIFLLGAISLDNESIKARFKDASRKLAAGVLFFTGFAVGMMWLGGTVPTLMTGEMPVIDGYTSAVFNFVRAMDLAILIPLSFTLGVLLLKRHAVAYTFIPVVLVKLVTLLAAILAMEIVMVRDGMVVTTAEFIIFPAVAVLVTLVLVRFLMALKPE